MQMKQKSLQAAMESEKKLNDDILSKYRTETLRANLMN